MKPYITVILLDYNRKEFLLDAFNSALNQTLDRSKYEIIVTKNFRDSKIDSYIKKNGGKLVFFEKGSYGEQVADALKYAKGEVICFLEDDDLFTKEKLKTIYSLMNDKIGYIHNGMFYINENGNQIKNEKYGNLETKTLVRDEDKDKKFNIPSINPSAICIKKKLLVGTKSVKEALSKIISGPDTFYYFVALDSNCDMLAIPDKLTKYRIHRRNTSFQLSSYHKFCEKQVKNSLRFLHDFRIAKKIVKKEITKEVLALHTSFMQITKSFYAGSRKDILKAYANYVKACKKLKQSPPLKLGIKIIFFVLWPNLIRYIYYKRIIKLK
jgi:glycosyltransferase involved in cell wall biosynthesis